MRKYLHQSLSPAGTVYVSRFIFASVSNLKNSTFLTAMKVFLASILTLFIFQNAHSQNFKAELRKLNGQVEAAYKSKKLTANEYAKLKKERSAIELAIEKALADDILTPDEKNKIHSKIVRSRKRLAKYKTNREIY
ncbi:hypothetical protein [Dyadobacter fermentans]|nr:hypothetical protein [Dyadobacter fermentans]